MTARTAGPALFIALTCGVFAGCANDGALSTAAISSNKVATTAPKVDPVCVSLTAQIDSLRQEGSVDRLEKAASGKGAKVSVKRESLAKQAELNKANADFQAKCAPVIPRGQTAQLPAGTAGAAQVAPIANTAVSTATSAAKTSANQAAATALTEASKQ